MLILCRIFVDGVEIGDHRAGGYVPFFLDVSAFMVNSKAGSDKGGLVKRELFVVADNEIQRHDCANAYRRRLLELWRTNALGETD